MATESMMRSAVVLANSGMRILQHQNSTDSATAQTAAMAVENGPVVTRRNKLMIPPVLHCHRIVRSDNVPMLNFYNQQLRELPVHADEIWQGALFQMPMELDDGKGKPYHPWAGLWAALVGDHIYPAMPQEGRADERKPELLLEGLIGFATDAQWPKHLPGKIQVRDSDVAYLLRSHVEELGIEVQLVDELPRLDEVLSGLMEQFEQAGPAVEMPGVCSGKGVKVEHVRGFAEAAEMFFRRAPWQDLLDVDLIAIEAPKAPEGMRYTTVLGAGGQTFGLGFHHTPDDCYDMMRMQDPEAWYASRKRSMWQFSFDDAIRTALEDVGFWDEHQLPRAAENAFPSLAGHAHNQAPVRADAKRLSFVEGLLRVLAQTTEEQMDSGRWSMAVETASGPMTFTLALPDVLNPPDFKELQDRGHEPDRRTMDRFHALVERFLADKNFADMDKMNEAIKHEFMGKVPDPKKYPPRTPLEKAMDLCFDAIDAKGRRQLQLIRQALAVCPDCAEAYVLLAERESDPLKASEHYEQAMAAGQRALGEQCFAEDVGHFWGIQETRPYMRARFGLAKSLAESGKTQEAVEHYRELLRLNPNDNQGVRYLYLSGLLELGNDAEAARYMQHAEDEHSASWTYARALLAFRLGGDCEASRKELSKALKSNPHVPPVMFDGEDSYVMPASYALGSIEEAIICVSEIGDAYKKTPGAVDWLDEVGLELLHAMKKAKQVKQRKRKK